MTEHLEGRESILAALRAYQRRFQVILIRQGAHREKLDELISVAGERGVALREASTAEFDALAHGATHGGVLAICSPKPRMTVSQLSELLDHLREPPLLLLLEGVDDARNLGFTLRTADAVGFHAVLIKKHLWDFDATEVARPASGAYERLPLIQIDEIAAVEQLQRRGLQLIGCIAGTKRTIYEAELARPTMLAIGGEKRGLSGAVRDRCDLFVTIPTREGASLSLSHAGAIVMGEAARQRGIRNSE